MVRCGAADMSYDQLKTGNSIVQVETAPRDKDILKLHILYLENIHNLSDKERKSFSCYLASLANPMMIVKTEDR